jgi:predicted nucleic acid-binding protein
VSKREIIIWALRLYGMHTVDFVDCILFATAQEENALVLSFDRDFKKLVKT